MTQTVTFTPTTSPLGLDPVWRSSPLILTGTARAGVGTYRAQLWRRPQDARVADAEALATSYATATGGSVSLAFSASQMDSTLAADNGGYDDFWLNIVGVQTDGQSIPLKAGWLRIVEAGADPDAFVIPGLTITVVDDVASFTLPGGPTFSIPVYQDDTVDPGDTGWEVSVVDDMIILTKDGVSYATAAHQQ